MTTYRVNGVVLSEEEWEASCKASAKERARTEKKRKSDAAGVHPTQIKEARDLAKRQGIAIDFTPDGRAIFTSAYHRKTYLRACGIHDRNGGYGDP